MYNFSSSEFLSGIIREESWDIEIKLIERSTELKKYKWIQFMVSPKQHCKHHEKYTGNYAAPLLNIDLLFK